MGEALPEPTLRRAWSVLSEAQLAGHHFIPFWHWESAPFLAKEKKAMLAEELRGYVKKLADQGSHSDHLKLDHLVRQLTRQWIHGSNLIVDFKAYLRPWKRAGDLERVLRVADIDIDLGIEYTASFPLMPVPRIGRDIMGHERRKKIFQNVALDIVGAFGGESVQEFAGGHGHDLGYGYRGVDAQGRLWTVEWDGVSRVYSAGNVLDQTIGKGHLELVTPKFSPTAKELETIYQVFKRHGLTLLEAQGSGHINVDLAPFAGRPLALARFLSLIHQYQKIIFLLFRAPGPIPESPRLTDAFYKKLKNFQGTEDELKGLLYNNRYYNARKNTKTKFTSINMAYYFQDVIPEELISEDFDFANSDGVPWRRQFRVDPNQRRMELRFFQAPRTAFESALQIRFVRAVLHKSLNENEPVAGNTRVDDQSYLQNPRKAYSDLAKLCSSLELDCRDYRPLVTEGLNDAAIYQKYFAQTWREKEIVEEGWGQALPKGRTLEEGIASRGRPWNGKEGISLCREWLGDHRSSNTVYLKSDR